MTFKIKDGISIAGSAFVDGSKNVQAGTIDASTVTLTGQLRGPASFVIDPAGVGDNTGVVVIKGDLQIDGTTTTINSTTLSIDDKNIVLADGAVNAAAADGAGITITGPTIAATFTYTSADDRWNLNKNLNVTRVYGTATNVSSSHTAGSYLTGSAFDGSSAVSWAVDATPSNTASKVVARDASGNFSASTITATLSGNASTASSWQTARTLSYTGDATGSLSVDGSTNVSTALTLAASGVTAGTYNNVTVNSKGLVTSGSNVAYLTSESDTLATVTARGASTSTESIFTGNLRARKSQTAGDYTTAALWTESFNTTTTGIAFHISGTVGKFLEMRTNGTLYWNSDIVWHSGNLTNLNQLANGPGYITGESDTLASVTARGASTSTQSSFNAGIYAPKIGIASSNLADAVNGAPWYGIGASNFTGWYGNQQTVQLAGYYGLKLKTANTELDFDVSGATSFIRATSGHLWVGNQTTPDNPGGWNRTITIDGTNHARLRLKASAYGSYGANEATFWHDNTVTPNTGITAPNELYLNATYTYASGSLRAPLFYDLDDTGYYVDPNSTSNLVTLNVNNYLNLSTSRTAGGHGHAGNFVSTQSAASNFIPFNFSSSRGNHSWGIIGRFRTDNASDTDRPSIQFSSAFNDTRWNIGYAGSDDNFRVVQNMGLRNDGGNDGWGTTRLLVDTSGNFYSYASIRSPIYYDSDDTGYYADPNNTSNFNNLTLGGRNMRSFEHNSFVEFYVEGDANTYYPVRFDVSAWMHWGRWSISRGYGDTAPWDPIGTGAHHGGLTLTWEWSGDGAWGGNDHNVRVVEWTEQYTTIVGGMALSVNGMIVWLRGGHAYYRFHGPGGMTNSATPYYSTYTASNGSTFAPRSNASSAAGEINYRYPVRGSGNLYDWDRWVLHENEWQNGKYFDSGGIIYANASMRAPIFYDQDNTGYYLDPNSTSTSLNIAGGISTPLMWVNYSPSNYNNFNEGIRLYSANNGAAVITFNTGGTTGSSYSSLIGYTDRLEKRWAGSWQERMYNGYSEASGSYRAPIFYDSNDTSYYGDFNSTSWMNAVKANVFCGRDSNGYGLYKGYDNNNHFISIRGAVSGTNSSLTISGAHHTTFVEHMAPADSSTGWFFKDSYSGGNYNYATIARISASDSWFKNYLTGENSLRAPIFYDSDDTGYFCNPNGTTTLNNLYVIGGVAGVSNSSSYTEAALEVRERGFGGAQDDTWATAPRIGFHWGGRVASQIAMNSSGRISILNNPGNGYEALACAAFYPTIMYDLNDTGYYVDPAGGNARISRDLYISGYTGGNYGNRLIVGNTDTSYTLQDGNVRPVIQIHGQYPVLSLNHTVTSNVSHGPTIQFTANGTGRQFVIGMNGTGTQLDIGLSNSTQTDWNPHNGIANYLGFTGFRMDIGGNVYNYASTRSPIFYDSDDTAYYVNPNSETRLWYTSVNIGQEASGGANSSNAGLVLRGNYNSNTWAHKFHKYDNGNGVPLYLSYTWSSNAWSALQGWGAGLSYTSQVFGSFAADTALYSPIFYDSNNTGYYADPASTSSLNALNVNSINGMNIYTTSGGYSYVASNPVSGGDRSQIVSQGLAIVSGYSTGANRPTTYDVTASFNASGKAFEISADWVSAGSTPLFVRSLRDCCQGWSAWHRIATYYYGSFGVDITSTGNVTAYSSDKRLKNNVTPIENAIDKVKALGGYTFDWDMEKCEQLNFTPSNPHEHGLIAQEVQEVIPDAVAPAPFDMDQNGQPISGENYLTVRYEKLVPLLVQAIKEQQKLIEDMQQKIYELEKSK